MSSFFRAPDDTTASEADEVTSSSSSEDGPSTIPELLDRIRTISTNDTDALDRVRAASTIQDAHRPDSSPTSLHQNMLVHALLEERCLKNATDQLNSQPDAREIYTTQHPQVQAKAQELYLTMTRELQNMGMLHTGPEVDSLRSQREQYRQGLDLLSSGLVPNRRVSSSTDPASSALTLPRDVKELLSLGPAPTNMLLATSAMRAMSLADFPNKSMLTRHTMLDMSRYHRDFVEMAQIGKGGYGEVFRVEHRLDGVQYAVKKIPVGESRMRRIQEKGPAELDHLLNELRTLARLDHPNIARYFGGWLEDYVSPASSGRQHSVLLLDSPSQRRDTSFGASPGPNIGHVSSLSDVDILFEHSNPEAAMTSQMEDSEQLEDARDLPIIPHGHHRTGTFSSTTSRKSGATKASVEDDEIETIPREPPAAAVVDASFPVSESSMLFTEQSGLPVPPKAAPVLTLHLQMSLYPLTLAEFLSSESQELIPSPTLIDDDPSNRYRSLRHCFHALISLLIFLSLLDGVEYLHSQGLVHRDLKPANIFLSVSDRQSASTACVNRHACRHCSHEAPLFMNFRIGDFGLVTSMASVDLLSQESSDATTPRPMKAVGTEHYRPASHAGTQDERLDLFALGVILFELLWPFSTRMERHQTLHALKEGALPLDFEHRVGQWGKQLGSCILSVMGVGDSETMSLQKLRQQIEAIVHGVEEK